MDDPVGIHIVNHVIDVIDDPSPATLNTVDHAVLCIVDHPYYHVYDYPSPATVNSDTIDNPSSHVFDNASLATFNLDTIEHPDSYVVDDYSQATFNVDTIDYLNSRVLDCPSPVTYKNSAPTTLESIQERFSFLSMEGVKTIFEITGHSHEKTINFLENCTLDNLLNLVYDYSIDFCTEEFPKLQITQEASDEEMAEVVLGFYKSNCFSKNACVRVSDGGQALDSGGVRRQLYSAAFEAVVDIYKFLMVLQRELGLASNPVTSYQVS